MKKIIILLPLLLLAIIYCIALGRFGLNFFSYATQSDNLTVNMLPQQHHQLGDSVALDISGTGFDSDLQVSLHMDVNNKNAIVGSLPLEGMINDLHKVGNRLFMANSRGLQQLDVSDPLSPQPRKTQLANSTVLDIEQTGKFLYLSCGSRGMRIFQLSNEGEKISHAEAIYTQSAALASVVVKDYLYVAAGQAGVLIYDVSNPGNSRQVGTITTENMVTRVVNYKNYLYLSTRKGGVQIYHLQEPGMPIYSGHLQVGKSANDVAIYNGHLYVIAQDRISVFSLTNPSKPEPDKNIIHLGYPRKIYFHEGAAYISDSHAGVKIVPLEQDVPGPAGYINMDGDPRALLRVDNYLYVALSRKGLVILDPKKVLSRQVVEEIHTPSIVSDIFARGNWLYIADSKGVFLTDLQNGRGELRQLSSLHGKSLIASGNHMYVAKGHAGVEVFDIQNPARPELAAHWPDLNSSLSLAISGSFLLSAGGSQGLSLFRLAGLEQPNMTDRIEGIHVLSVRAVGDMLYAATQNKGVQLYRISLGGTLTLVSQILAPFPMEKFAEAIDLQVHEGLAYVANGRGGLLIADVRDPQRPIILSTLQLPGITTTVRVAGDRVYTANRFGGVQVIDISSPQQPKLLDQIDIYGLTHGLQVFSGKLYLASGFMGVTAIPIPQQAEGFELISSERIKVRLPSPNFPGRYSIQLSNGKEQVTLGGVLKYGESQKL